MLYTFPLSRWLDVPQELRSKIWAVRNPIGCPGDLEKEGFRGDVPTIGFELNVDETFWYLYEDRPATIQANSGCPYRCEPCVWNRTIFPRRQWAHPVVTGQLSSLAKNPYVICSQLTGDHEWLEAFVEARRLPLNTFSTDLNAAHVEKYEADIRRLAEAGMTRAIVGVEALSDSALRKIRCPHTVEQARKMFALLAELGVEGVYQIRYGYGETLAEIQETRRTLTEVAETCNLAEAPHGIRTGGFYYWHESHLSRSLKLRTVAPLGYPVQVEDVDEARRAAWVETYGLWKELGLDVR
jgi:radical SAM superfamily enzyme YgiQ (UPF0313 family)